MRLPGAVLAAASTGAASTASAPAASSAPTGGPGDHQAGAGPACQHRSDAEAVPSSAWARPSEAGRLPATASGGSSRVPTPPTPRQGQKKNNLTEDLNMLEAI
eukprot:scaffold85183_cov39-Phaeocystis_antarctica.AAC.1